MAKQTILIIGSGGREHALAWKLKQSPKVGKIFAAPGNAGTSLLAENIDIKATDILALADFAEKNKIDFTVVGPDDSLAFGVVDEFQKRGLKIWGPTKAAAQIEASKAFAKDLMKKQNIPTAEFETFTDYEKALEYIERYFAGSPPLRGGVGGGWLTEKQNTPPPSLPPPTFAKASAGKQEGGIQKPIVIKASGLALGKGVTICKTIDEAKAALKDAMIDKIFGDSGSQVVIEEFLQGQEFSIHAFCDGKNFKLLPSSQDHKAIFDGGLGPNTGGMGTIAPVPWVDEQMMNEVSSTIVEPALEGLKKLNTPFVGLLYPGLMALNHPHLASPLKGEEGTVSADVFPLPRLPAEALAKVGGEGLGEGDIKVIEFNSRFGDPETQSYMRLLKTDLLDILEACVDGKLNDINIEWENKFACCIVLASGGYPGKYEKGKTITGINEAEALDDIIIFHAGTKIDGGKLVTSGGRVLGVTAISDNLQSALNKAYAAVKLIHFDGMHYRTDIGQKSLISSKL